MRPNVIHALIESLRFDKPDSAPLCGLSDSDWERLLDFTDRSHITLALAIRQPDCIPAWVRERLDRNVARNSERLRRRKAAYVEIAQALEQRGIEAVILKGFSHDTPMRPQGDIDLLCAPEQAEEAQDAVISLGYEAVTLKDEFPADHLPLLVRRTGWRWRGDWYDIDQPVSVEIHYRLWNPAVDRVAIDGLDDFWARRQIKDAGGLRFPALDRLDILAYASLHALRHLLHADLLLWHVYELALTLEQLAGDDRFWAEWQVRYNLPLRQKIEIPFRLAAQWFGCRLTAPCELPEPVEQWLQLYTPEPKSRTLFPNKRELWLHVSLVENRAYAVEIIRRRLLPAQRRAIYHTHVPPSEETLRITLQRKAFQISFLARRVFHHARTFVPAVAGGLLWWLRSRGLPPAFFRFLGAASLFNFGMTVFFLLYNLHLLKRGFHEDFLGPVATSMTLGSISGAIPAGIFTNRYGLKPALLFAFVAAPLICVARVVTDQPAVLIVTAFLSGLAMSLYQVSLAPVVAQLAPERVRPLAFSLVLSLGIGIGVFGSAVGGAMPDWLGGLPSALIAACAFAALSGLPVLKLSLHKPASRTHQIYPRDPMVTRYLAALGLWSLATGTMNPFFNVYFSTQLKIPLHSIGIIFSGSHVVQVAAVLAAPLVLRRLGVPNGIMAMQVVTGVALGLLSIGPPLAGAAILYASYMAFQYMSEPGMFSFLMDHAREEERSGAAALNMLVLLGGQAIAATLSGLALRRFGYPAVLIIASLLAIVAGFCFRFALSRETPVLLERSAAR